jgi:hypothetical protein
MRFRRPLAAPPVDSATPVCSRERDSVTCGDLRRICGARRGSVVTRVEIECAVNKVIPQTCPGESSISRKCQEVTASTKPRALAIAWHHGSASCEQQSHGVPHPPPRATARRRVPRFTRSSPRPTPSHAAHLRLNVRFARCPPRPKARTVPPLRWRGSCGRATEASIHHPLQEAESEHTAASLVPQLSSTHIFLLFAASRRALDLAGVPILSTP